MHIPDGEQVHAPDGLRKIGVNVEGMMRKHTGEPKPTADEWALMLNSLEDCKMQVRLHGMFSAES